MATLSATIAQLDAAWRRLRLRWEGTRALWSDSVQHDFEVQYWTPLERQVQVTHREMQALSEMVAQALRNVR